MVMTQEPRPTPELLPCPFCGGEGFVSEDDRGRARWVSCDRCECDGPVVGYGTADTYRDLAINKWNKRVPPTRTLTPEQVERARWILRRRSEIPEVLDSIDLNAQVFQLLREVVGDVL